MPKYKLQEMNDVHKTGEKKVYPKLLTYRQLDTEEFLDRMYAHGHAISRSAAAAVLADVADYLGEALSEGYTVRLDGIGHFAVALDFDDDKPRCMESDDDRMAYRKVTVRDVNYTPSPRLLTRLKTTTELTRDAEGVSRLRKQLYTQEERIARAEEWLESHPTMTLTEYATLNNLSRSSASRELRSLSADADSPFATVGKSSHKVWVKRQG